MSGRSAVQPFRGRGAADPRHHHVRDQEGDRSRVGGRQGERPLAVLRREHLVAVRFQDLPHHLAERLRVLDQEDRLRGRAPATATGAAPTSSGSGTATGR